MNNLYQYLIQFLLGDAATDEIVSQIGYTNNPDELNQYKLVIKPSGFFDPEMYDSDSSIPKLPLTIWEESPVLYGEDKVETIGNTIVLHADLIASTYFLVSRYEEMVRRNIRDVHNRFPGKESIPYKAGFIDRPIIEEWGCSLRTLLRQNGIEIPEPPQEIKKIYLTHDVDQMAHYRNLRGMLGGVIRGLKRPKEGDQALKSYFGGLKFDPWYTFPYIYRLDLYLQSTIGADKCEIITFFRSGGGKLKEDKPFVNVLHPDYKHLINYTKRKNVTIGLHSSYQAGCTPQLIDEEKKRLEKTSKQTIYYNRNHYLNNREPEDFEYLIKNQFTDDFSMGYADIAGFRLGTCRSVKWINPVTQELTQLSLHPLTIMDVSLSDKRYMYMNAHEARLYCEHLIGIVGKYNGEISLLWHNNVVEKSPLNYHRKLYRDLLKIISSKFNQAVDISDEEE